MRDKQPARRANYKGRVEFRHEADDLTPNPGDCVMVVRGRPRSLVMACPDGCGQHLTINLDGRSGPAWRTYETSRGLTLYPSVWRDTGCGSHFIVWHNTIIWCEWLTEDDQEPKDQPKGLVERVFAILSDEFSPFLELAERLGEIPWEVSRACRILKGHGRAEEDVPPRRGYYRRTKYKLLS